MPVPGAPTVRGNAPAPAANAAQVPVVPFTRASRKKSMLANTIGPIALTANQQPLPLIQIQPAGYIRSLDIEIVITSAGNAATVAFAPDAPWNAIANMWVNAANGDSILNPLDGYAWFAINKYLCIGETAPNNNPKLKYGYLLTPGNGATGGSAKFFFRVPFEVDARDAFCALPNMAANKAYQFQLFLNTLANIYTVAPTVAPTVTLTVTMNYWQAPDGTNAAGNPQATSPIGDGSLSLIQTQTPPIVAGSNQTFGLTNVGSVKRATVFILRNGAGARVDTNGWAGATSLLLNNDVMFYKTKDQWQADMSNHYSLPGALEAANGIDTGVFVLDDFIVDGADGNGSASAGQNRNLWLPTESTSSLQMTANAWGSAAGSLQVLDHIIKPASPTALYASFTM